MKIDVFTLFPDWFEWFPRQRHVRNALELGHELEFVDLRATTPLGAGQVDDTPYGGGAGVGVGGGGGGPPRRAPPAPDRPAPPTSRGGVPRAAGGRQFDDELAGELAAE